MVNTGQCVKEFWTLPRLPTRSTGIFDMGVPEPPLCHHLRFTLKWGLSLVRPDQLMLPP